MILPVRAMLAALVFVGVASVTGSAVQGPWILPGADLSAVGQPATGAFGPGRPRPSSRGSADRQSPPRGRPSRCRPRTPARPLPAARPPRTSTERSRQQVRPSRWPFRWRRHHPLCRRESSGFPRLKAVPASKRRSAASARVSGGRPPSASPGFETGKPIRKATKVAYKLIKADRGKIVTCRVTAQGPGGRAVVVSLGVLVR